MKGCQKLILISAEEDFTSEQGSPSGQPDSPLVLMACKVSWERDAKTKYLKGSRTCRYSLKEGILSPPHLKFRAFSPLLSLTVDLEVKVP